MDSSIRLVHVALPSGFTTAVLTVRKLPIPLSPSLTMERNTDVWTLAKIILRVYRVYRCDDVFFQHAGGQL